MPFTLIIAEDMTMLRCASKTRCHRIALAMPVSSSIVMKVTLVEPGRWRRG
jgi:hypothetical protein